MILPVLRIVEPRRDYRESPKPLIQSPLLPAARLTGMAAAAAAGKLNLSISQAEDKRNVAITCIVLIINTTLILFSTVR